MKYLAIRNKEIRGQIKLLKTELFVIEKVCFEMLKFFTDEQKNSMINDAKKVLIQDVDEAKIREYLLRNNHNTSYSVNLKDIIRQSLDEKM
jgi:hypothetical protein